MKTNNLWRFSSIEQRHSLHSNN